MASLELLVGIIDDLTIDLPPQAGPSRPPPPPPPPSQRRWRSLSDYPTPSHCPSCPTLPSSRVNIIEL